MKKKTIFIEGLGLVEGHFSGVGQYILGILKGMDELIDEMRSKGEHVPEVRVIIPYDKVYRFKEFNFKNISYKSLPIPFKYMSGLWSRRLMPPIDIFCGRGEYIFPRFVDMPLLFNKSRAVVVFDLSYELYRQYSDEGNAKFLSKNVKESIQNTQKVITI